MNKKSCSTSRMATRDGYTEEDIAEGCCGCKKVSFNYCKEANSNSNHAIHNNQTTQNQLSIINTQTNENEKTPTPKTQSSTYKKRGRKSGREREPKR